MEDKIKIGDTVQCRYTGLKGIAMSKLEFINKCVQFGVQPKWNPKSTIPIEQTETFIDIQSLELIKKGERWRDPVRDKAMLEALESDGDDDEEPTGGPMRTRRATTVRRITR